MKKAKGFGDSNSPKKSKLSKEDMQALVDGMNRGDKDSFLKWINFERSLFNEGSEEPDSIMIHERDYVPMDCFICGKHMPSIHDSHNPEPITPHCTAKKALEENLPYRCCSQCDHNIVLPERFRRFK